MPAHWLLERLKFIALNRASNVDKHSSDGEVTVLLCNYTDVYNNERITDDLPFMQATATEQEIKRFSIKAGDVLITKDSESWDDIAIPAYVPDTLSGVLCGYHLSLIRPLQERLFGGFLYYLLASTAINRQFQLSANGVTRFGLPAHRIDNAELLIPPLSEQRAIAAFLDERTAKIDALIAKKERLLTLLAEKRQAIITRAVTKGIDPTASLKDTRIPWLGEIPAHWALSSVRRFLVSLRDGTHNPPPRADSEYRLLSARNIVQGELVLLPDDRTMELAAFLELERSYTVRTGDVVLAVVGATTGKSAVVGNTTNVSAKEV